MISWPEPLKNDLASRRAVLFLGGGVSRNSLSRDGTRRPPLWDQLLTAGLKKLGTAGTRHIKKALSEKDYLHACEWIKKRMDEDWVPFLRSELVDPQYEASEIHDVLFRLDQRIYLTPNFDSIFENFVTAQTGGQIVVKRFCDPDVHNFLRDDSGHVIKVHGSINNPAELIFSQHDYAAARVKYSAFYDALDACLLSHTFRFIGCGVSAPDLALILENQRFNFPFARPHYLVTSSKISADLSDSLRQNRNLKCLIYDPSDNHADLLQSLKVLLEEVEEMTIRGPSPSV